jgi:carboxymethylenebutenolidase
VIFYGRSPGPELAPRIACPVLGFYGGDDPMFNASVPPFAEAMATAGKRFEQHTFPGVKHAFFNDNRPTYDVRAARAAFSRTLAFFAAELG